MQRRVGRLGLAHHGKQVLGVVQRRNQLNLRQQPGAAGQGVHAAQGRIILQRKPHRIKHRNLLRCRAPCGLSLQHAPELGDGKVGRHLLQLALDAGLRLVFDKHLGALQQGRLPIMLGGDHTLATGSISAVARHCRAKGQRLRVLWLDAHSDCNTPDNSPSGNLHGMPVASLCGLGPQALIEMSGAVPALPASAFCQIGLRSVDMYEKHMIRELGLHVFDMRAIDELGMREVMRRALADLGPNDHLHVSFDVDFLDPDIAPGTGTPVRGGPNYREAQLCMEMMADTGRLGSLDIVELNPALDLRNQTAELVVDLVQSLFGQSTLARE